MGVDVRIVRPAGRQPGSASEATVAAVRARFGYARNPETIERLTRPCPTCFAEPTRWCKAGWGKRFSAQHGFLHEDR